jgi:hypothetical protein
MQADSSACIHVCSKKRMLSVFFYVHCSQFRRACRRPSYKAQRLLIVDALDATDEGPG